MRTLSLAAVLAVFTVALVSGTAEAKNTSLCFKAHGLREAVIEKHGKRAPGRNLCRVGVVSKYNASWSKPATTRQKARYVRTLRSLLAPAPAYLVRTAVPPSQAPAGTLTPGIAAGGTLERIAACESGGDPTAVSPDGKYRGKYQFLPSTWASVGGSGDPAQASEAEQDMRAAKLLASGGPGHWPVCSKR